MNNENFYVGLLVVRRNSGKNPKNLRVVIWACPWVVVSRRHNVDLTCENCDQFFINSPSELVEFKEIQPEFKSNVVPAGLHGLKKKCYLEKKWGGV